MPKDGGFFVDAFRVRGEVGLGLCWGVQRRFMPVRYNRAIFPDTASDTAPDTAPDTALTP